MRKLIGIALTFAATLSAQVYSGNAEGTNCGTISGWAWDSTQPNTSINVDIYNNGVPLVSIPANIFRQDLLNAGIGNGVHGFSLATPGSLKDGHAHAITLYYGGSANQMSGVGNNASITCTGGPGYQYYYTDVLTSINTNNWTQNGAGSAGASGYTSSDANGGSLISKIAVPDGTSNYEVKMKLSLAASGGTYVSYLRATSNALAANGNTGTFYAIEVQNPTFTQNGAACTATLLINKSVAGSVTTLWGSTIACHSLMAVRTVVNTANNYILVYVDNRTFGFATDSSIQAGQPGVGVIGAPAGNVIAEADLGPLDRVAPQAVNAQSVTTSSFANRVDFAWQGAADDANGTGVSNYCVYRNGAFFQYLSGPVFTDSTVAPGTTYTYGLIPFDFHYNGGPTTTLTVTTPPAGSVDPRQVGVRPTGTYWGAAGEQIDLRSGNLNFRLPLVKAAGRGGSGFALGLSYNSTNWRQDPGGTWQLGHDVGYGYGWKLQAGSLLPVYSDWLNVHHYLFTDASGAEYRLDQNTNGVWTSKEGIYAAYDTSTQRLYFPDGTFWFFGAVSAGTEEDAGTLYPTQFQDTNGNQILLRYGAASGLPWTGSSARIVQVEDVRAVSQGSGVYASYNLNYNTDGIPHLTSIANTIGTAESYTFTLASQTLMSPFAATSYGPINTLASVKQTGTGQTTSFTYGSTGSLFQMNTPFGGYIRWAYTNSSYTGGIQQREVQNRYLVKSSGSPETAYPIARATPGAAAAITDPGGQGQKVWFFRPTPASSTSAWSLPTKSAKCPARSPRSTTITPGCKTRSAIPTSEPP